MRRKTASVSAVVDPAIKKAFAELSEKKRLTVSEHIGLLMEQAVDAAKGKK